MLQLRDRDEVQASLRISSMRLFSNYAIAAKTLAFVDSLVYVAHHVRLGKRCLVGAGAAVTGSVTIGDDVRIGPNATIASEITIGDRANITLGSVVTRDSRPDQHVTGDFAIDPRSTSHS